MLEIIYDYSCVYIHKNAYKIKVNANMEKMAKLHRNWFLKGSQPFVLM